MKKTSFLCQYGCLRGVCKKCPSKTCSQLAKQCGNWDNGCRVLLNCGACSAGQTCSHFGFCISAPLKEADRCSDLNSEVKETTLLIKNSGKSISLKEGEKVYSDTKSGPNLFVLNNKQGGVILKIDSIKIDNAKDGSITFSDYITKSSIKILLVNINGIYKKEGLNIFGGSNINIQVDSNGVFAVVNWPLHNEIDSFECA